ncbi:MaoC/PaaZ C-terminal domain-containing protein [Chloroflexota bacterium]
MSNRYWEDFKVGERMATACLTITETHIVNFSSLTGDWHPIHTDDEFARHTVFGGRIAHGPLIFSLAVGLVVMSGIQTNRAIALLGADELKFPSPVRLGDTIYVEVEVMGKRETRKSGQGVLVLQYTVKNQKGVTVMTVRMSELVERKCSEVN